MGGGGDGGDMCVCKCVCVCVPFFSKPPPTEQTLHSHSQRLTNSLLSHHSSSVPVTTQNPMLPPSMQPNNNNIREASRVTCPYPWGPYEWGECDVQNTCGYQGAIGNCPQGQLCCATYHCGNICRWSVGY